MTGSVVLCWPAIIIVIAGAHYYLEVEIRTHLLSPYLSFSMKACGLGTLHLN